MTCPLFDMMAVRDLKIILGKRLAEVKFNLTPIDKLT